MSLNIRKIITTYKRIFADTRTEDSFRDSDLTSCNSLVENSGVVLCAVLLSCLVSELHKPSSPGVEPSFFGVVAVVHVMSWKQTTLVFALVFCRA
jgi:hypothetical protein